MVANQQHKHSLNLLIAKIQLFSLDRQTKLK